jgi:uncharacterized repeat protein (TIGR04052 family)
MTFRTWQKRAAWVSVLGAVACGDSKGGDASDAGRDAGAEERDAAQDAGAVSDAAQDAASELKAVTIRFAAKVGERDFACGERYPGQGSTGVEVEPLDFRFYVQDLRLINAAGEEVPVQMDERLPWQTPEVALLDFENAEGRCDATREINTEITGKVPPGEYTGVAFKNGVPHALNHENPATVPAPLQAPGASWGWLLGFRFVLAELGQVAGDAGAGGVGVFHLGSTACEGDPQGGGSVTCAHPNRTEVRLTGFDPDTNKVVADIGALFAHTDLSKAQVCHSNIGSDHGHGASDGADAGAHAAADGGHDVDGGQASDGGQHAAPGAGHANPCTPMFTQMGVDPHSGHPLEAQSVFRVE